MVCTLRSVMKRSIFLEGGIEKLSFDYVPSKLPHREEFVEKMVNFLKVVIDQPCAISERILITGKSGTGKTVTAKRVGSVLKIIAEKRGVNLVYAHINCRTTPGKYGLVQRIIRKTAPVLPLRGYSSTELLHALWDYLNEHDIILLLTLDEIDYFIRSTGEDIVYELTRLTDEVKGVPQRINFIFIGRSQKFLNELSPSTLSKFRPQERFEFPPYVENQLIDILSQRVKEAFIENAVSEEILTFIARNTVKYGHGDARYALQLLLSSGLIAEREGCFFILPEHVREAQEKTDPKLRDEDVMVLPEEEKFLLLALARRLKGEREAVFLPLEAVEETYNVICEEYGRKPVGRVLLHALASDLEAAGIITLSEDFQMGLDGVKAEILEKFLVDLLRESEGRRHIDT